MFNLKDPEPRSFGVPNNRYMSIVFSSDYVKLYLYVDRGFADSLTPSLRILIKKNGTFWQNEISSDRTIHINDENEQELQLFRYHVR